VAGFECIASVGTSLERALNGWFTQLAITGAPGTRAVLARTEDFKSAAGGPIRAPALSIFLYRVDFNKSMRAAWSGVGSNDGMAHLPLDLHYMLTPWAKDASVEHAILGAAMQYLEMNPILSGPLLTTLGGWAPNEGVQVVLEDTPTEWVMRTFDSLPTDFKLSVPYLARVLVLDGSAKRGAPGVTTVITGLTPGAAP